MSSDLSSDARTPKRVALITGSHKGLGLEIAKQLARSDSMFVILSGRREAEGRAVKAALESGGLKVGFVALDVTDSPSVRRGVDAILREHGGIDVLVNNAGVNPGQDASEASVLTAAPETVIAALDANALGALRVSQAVAPRMRATGYGRIVNVSTEMASLAAIAGDFYPASPSYRISKVAMNAVTALLAREFRGSNILVNAYSPGWLRTDMGGPNAPFSVEEGAQTAVHLAMLPEGGVQGGGFFAEMRRLGGPMALSW